MKLLHAIVAGLMLVVWLPATSHPLLEHAGVIHQSHESGDSGDSDTNHDGADGFCILPDGGGLLVKGIQSHGPLVTTIAVIFIVSPRRPQHLTDAGGLGPSPPLLARTWQFVYRAALPSRAPSIA